MRLPDLCPITNLSPRQLFFFGKTTDFEDPQTTTTYAARSPCLATDKQTEKTTCDAGDVSSAFAEGRKGRSYPRTPKLLKRHRQKPKTKTL
ncbi:hypothetical protein TNIN_239841 [Trichonephila inaurata madagascariensis]|uniref:Uncharacterized protein n=1 Tax=Trichonephila inaurata madagascariensis TaxID=2747483 RepID=A0A8X7CB73_9ARAC|nr:hypothetical protein TNIN_239841 [Trichonephila inaurata madagascariensis]